MNYENPPPYSGANPTAPYPPYGPGGPGPTPYPGYPPGPVGYQPGQPGFQPGQPGYQPGQPGYQGYPQPQYGWQGGQPPAPVYMDAPKNTVVYQQFFKAARQTAFPTKGLLKLSLTAEQEPNTHVKKHPNGLKRIAGDYWTVYVVEERRDNSGESACLTACWTALCCCCLWDMLT